MAVIGSTSCFCHSYKHSVRPFGVTGNNDYEGNGEWAGFDLFLFNSVQSN